MHIIYQPAFPTEDCFVFSLLFYVLVQKANFFQYMFMFLFPFRMEIISFTIRRVVFCTFINDKFLSLISSSSQLRILCFESLFYGENEFPECLKPVSAKPK